MITCFAVWAASLPKSFGVTFVDTVSPKVISFFAFLASLKLTSVSGLVTSSTTILFSKIVVSPVSLISTLNASAVG